MKIVDIMANDRGKKRVKKDVRMKVLDEYWTVKLIVTDSNNIATSKKMMMESKDMDDKKSYKRTMLIRARMVEKKKAKVCDKQTTGKQ